MNKIAKTGKAFGPFVLMLAVAMPLGLYSCKAKNAGGVVRGAKVIKDMKAKHDKEKAEKAKKADADLQREINKIINQQQ